MCYVHCQALPVQEVIHHLADQVVKVRIFFFFFEKIQIFVNYNLNFDSISKL